MGQLAATAPCPAVPPSHLLPPLLLCRIPGLGILHPSSGFSRARLRRGQRWRPWKAVTVQEGRTAVCGGDPDSQGGALLEGAESVQGGFRPFSLLLSLPSCPPHPSPLPSTHLYWFRNSVDLHVRQSLATHTRRTPQPWRCGGVSSRGCSTV